LLWGKLREIDVRRPHHRLWFGYGFNNGTCGLRDLCGLFCGHVTLIDSCWTRGHDLFLYGLRFWVGAVNRCDVLVGVSLNNAVTEFDHRQAGVAEIRAFFSRYDHLTRLD
jgi:hypothetical protein